MRYVIGCLALIGLGIILAIGGCLGIVGIGIASLPKTPDYATRSYIEKEYAGDLKLIDQAIAADKIDTLAAKVSDDVVAIFLKDTDLLKKHVVQSKSFSEFNGIGSGTVRTNATTQNCLIFQMKKGDADYEVFLVDHGPPAGSAKPVK
jgi:hypothetical protein